MLYLAGMQFAPSSLWHVMFRWDAQLTAACIVDIARSANPEAEAAAVIRWGLDKGAADPLELEPVFGALNPFDARNTAPNISRQERVKPPLGHSGSRFSSGP